MKIPAHPDYRDPSFGTRQLEAFLDDPNFAEHMADADKVAAIIVEATMLEKKGELGLRLPVGPDSWSFIKGKHDGELEGLEKVRELSFKTGNESILTQTSFLYE